MNRGLTRMIADFADQNHAASLSKDEQMLEIQRLGEFSLLDFHLRLSAKSVLQTFRVFAACADSGKPEARSGTAGKESARELREWIQEPANE
jgi:hypothetical protein